MRQETGAAQVVARLLVLIYGASHFFHPPVELFFREGSAGSDIGEPLLVAAGGVAISGPPPAG